MIYSEKKKEIAEEFNNHFSSIANKTKRKIPDAEKHFSEYLHNPSPDSILFYPTTTGEVAKLILQINNTKSTGLNSIPSKFTKDVAPQLCIILSTLINESMDKGIFPSCLKCASITTIFKKNSKLLVKNYRPSLPI